MRVQTGRSIIAGLAFVLLGGASAAGAECPSQAEILEKVEAARLERGARTVLFSTAAPTALYEKAAAQPGQPWVRREGKRAYGVVVAELPVEALWKAIADEDHHDLAGYVPVRRSEVISGTPRGERRVVFQYFLQLGVGRWWVSEVRVNRELYAASGGLLWEVTWEDLMDSVDPSAPPMNSISSELPPLVSSRGAWILLPLAESCTLVEQFTWTDPGGVAGALQPLLARQALRDTIEGIVEMAAEHVGSPHPGPPFVRPDGTSILAGSR